MWKRNVHEMPWYQEISGRRFSAGMGSMVAWPRLETGLRRIVGACRSLKDGKANVWALRNAREEEEISSNNFFISFVLFFSDYLSYHLVNTKI